MNHQHLNTIAILGTDTLAEGILARLLEREGYATTIIEAYPTGLVEELLDDVDILLVAPGLKDGVHEGFLEAMRNAPKTATWMATDTTTGVPCTRRGFLSVCTPLSSAQEYRS